MKYSVIITAAGSGTRMNLGYNKVFYIMPDGRSVLQYSLDLFAADENCEEILVALSESDFDRDIGNVHKVLGGKTRAESVYNGLKEVRSSHVLIHDGARPFLRQEEVNRLLERLEEHPACILAVREKDTLKETEGDVIVQTIDRSRIWHAQTPQAFQTGLIKDCLARALEDNMNVTDDSSAVEIYGNIPVHVVEGDEHNIKITTPADLG